MGIAALAISSAQPALSICLMAGTGALLAIKVPVCETHAQLAVQSHLLILSGHICANSNSCVLVFPGCPVARGPAEAGIARVSHLYAITRIHKAAPGCQPHSGCRVVAAVVWYGLEVRGVMCMYQHTHHLCTALVLECSWAQPCRACSAFPEAQPSWSLLPAVSVTLPQSCNRRPTLHLCVYRQRGQHDASVCQHHLCRAGTQHHVGRCHRSAVHCSWCGSCHV